VVKPLKEAFQKNKLLCSIRDRDGNTSDSILEIRNKDTLADVLAPLINKDTLLCSDKKTSYTAFAKNSKTCIKLQIVVKYTVYTYFGG